MEGGTLAILRVKPDIAIVEIGDFLAYRETYACAGVFVLGVETLEYQEYLILKLIPDPDTIIRHAYLPEVDVFCT